MAFRLVHRRLSLQMSEEQLNTGQMMAKQIGQRMKRRREEERERGASIVIWWWDECSFSGPMKECQLCRWQIILFSSFSLLFPSSTFILTHIHTDMNKDACWLLIVVRVYLFHLAIHTNAILMMWSIPPSPMVYIHSHPGLGDAEGCSWSIGWLIQRINCQMVYPIEWIMERESGSEREGENRS